MDALVEPRILIVDDEEAFRTMIHQFLEGIGYACEVAANASEALGRLSGSHFDLVISDIRMKGKDGLQFTREARGKYPHLDFIIMTGYAANYSYTDIIEAGATDFLAKPFSTGELKAKIERIKRTRRILQYLHETNESLMWQTTVNSAIAEVSRVLIASLPIEAISSLVLKHAKQLTMSPLGYVSYLVKKPGYPISGDSSETVWEDCVLGDRGIFCKDLYQSNDAFLQLENPVLTNSVEKDFKDLGFPETLIPVHRFLLVPAVSNGVLFGQIALANAEQDYTEKELSVVKRLAGIYALAIQRKRGDDELRQKNAELQSTLVETINILTSALEMRDPLAAGHQRRVAHLASTIAREMGLSQHIIDGVHMAGLVHDIGNISVPSEILTKPCKLQEQEMNVIRQHPKIGFHIFKGVRYPWPIAEIVLQHHERMDGSGYPHGLLGQEILLEARIIAVADVVEAISSPRTYRSAPGLQKALEEISRNKGILYDFDVAEACLRVFNEKDYCFE